MNSAPPKIAATGRHLPAIIVGVTFLGIAGVVFFFNPATHHFYPECQFHRLTGLNCPGCGMTRAAYALLHGEIAVAIHDNALLVGGLIWLVLRGGWFGVNKLLGKPNGEFFPAKYLWLLLVLALVFTVVRNLPAGAFLSP